MASLPPSSTILFLNLPPKTFVGIDLLSFHSSPNFHGITNVPPGFHFLYTSTDASLAIRQGRWVKVPFKRIEQQQQPSAATAAHVFKWAGSDECLVLLPANSSEAAAARNAIATLRDRGALVEYQALEDAKPQDGGRGTTAAEASSPSDWRRLVSHVDDRLLTRILSSTDWTLTSVSSAPQDTEHIPGLSRLEASSVLSSETKLSFVPVNLKQTWPVDAIGRDRTDGARDRSWYLGHLIDSLASDLVDSNSNASANANRQDGARALLGEMQFCFVMVLVLANYSCLEQWKRLLSVIFTCQTALTQVEPFFVEALKLLTLQMAHVDDVDGGLFDLRGDESNSAWLRQLIRKFRGNVEEEEQTAEEEKQRTATTNQAGGHLPLWKQLDSFEAFMKEHYNWESGRDWLKRGLVELEDGDKVELTVDGADEDDETGEYAPVIVET